MRAVRIDAPGAYGVVDLPAPEPGPGEVVVDIAYAGICGSDVELAGGGRPEPFAAYPVIPGHEWSGTVAAVGAGVDPALWGRKVVGEGFRSCHACAPCLAGLPVLCEGGYDEIGFTRHGAWAEQLLIPAEQLHLLRADADLRSAAVLEPAACSAEAVRQAAIEPGQRVAIVGAGAIGSLAVQLARVARPAELVVVEPNHHRADLAERCGATSTVTPADAGRLHGHFDVVIEAAGALNTATLALELLRRGGRLVLAGIPGQDATLRVSDLVARRATIATVFGAPHAAWLDAVRAFDAGELDPGLLVTHMVDLASMTDALALVGSRDGAVGKVLVAPRGIAQPE